MPQMMPIYWFVIFFFVNMFLHFFFSFYYHNLVFFSKFSPSMEEKKFFSKGFLK